MAANEKRRHAVADRVISVLGGDVAGHKVAILGIAFKADTDDIRDAAALAVIPSLQAKGAHISAYDPAAMEHGRNSFQNVTWCSDIYSAASGADIVVVLTEWNEFRGLDFAKLKTVVKGKVILDFRNLYVPDEVVKAGFSYHSLGRASHLVG